MNRPPGIPTISPQDAAAELEAARTGGDASPGRPLLVDVREHDEFATERIAGAALLPISELRDRHRDLPTDRPLLVLCQAGARSQSATMFLLQSGWTDVRNVEGGVNAWKQAGLPVETGAPQPGEGELPS
jgi:rhodanese-related sulfurtransferase